MLIYSIFFFVGVYSETPGLLRIGRVRDRVLRDGPPELHAGAAPPHAGREADRHQGRHPGRQQDGPGPSQGRHHRR